MRPQTSGKPGQRGFHGIGSRKPNNMAVTGHNDDLDDMLDGFGGGNDIDPLTAINQKKAAAQKKRQKPAVVEEDDDGLGFLKKAAEESKRNEERRH